MASKVVMMLILCYTLFLAVQMVKADFLLVEYGKCFKDCHDNCQTQGRDDAFCKLKCDNECMAKKTADKLYKVKSEMVAARQSAQSTVPINADGQPAENSKPSKSQPMLDTEHQINANEQSTQDAIPQVNN